MLQKRLSYKNLLRNKPQELTDLVLENDESVEE